MKELGITDNAGGIKTTFQEIYDISMKCKFADCKHLNETGCAVIEALGKGDIDRDSYENYIKIQKEQERFQTSVAEKRKKDKTFGKMLKNYNKVKGKNEL
jgi:ribosome biogenesis GTPase